MVLLRSGGFIEFSQLSASECKQQASEHKQQASECKQQASEHKQQASEHKQQASEHKQQANKCKQQASEHRQQIILIYNRDFLLKSTMYRSSIIDSY